MGTHALIILRTRNSNGEYTNYATIYVHWDGYPQGLGGDLYVILEDVIIVNGISADISKKVANGSGCLFAQIIMKLKHQFGEKNQVLSTNKEYISYAGGIYLLPPNATQKEEWMYYITVDDDAYNTIDDNNTVVDNQIEVEINNYDEKCFKGTVKQMKDFVV